MNQMILLLILHALSANAIHYSNWTTSIVCEHDSGDIHCPIGQTIEIGYAMYHRSSVDVCPHPAGNESCTGMNVLPIVGKDCNQRQSCSIDSKKGRYGDPCYGIFKYMEVLYRCIDPRDDFTVCQESVQKLEKQHEQDQQRIANLTDTVVSLQNYIKQLNLSHCSMNDADGWISVLSRVSEGLNFERKWDDYVEGFNDFEGNCWIGLERLHRLTCCDKEILLRVDMRDWYNDEAYAEYDEFEVENGSTNYRATFAGYNGTAGDSLSYTSGMEFSTVDRDNDNWSGSCARYLKGGWWYGSCTQATPTGNYYRPPAALSVYDFTGIHWASWKNNWYHSLQKMTMKIRILN